MNSLSDLDNLCRPWGLSVDSQGHCFGADPLMGPYGSGFDRQTECAYFEYSAVKDRCKFFIGYRNCSCDRALENAIVARKIEDL